MTESVAEVPLRVIAAQWARLGCVGFGGPPAHIALLRKLVVDARAWLDPREFEDGALSFGGGFVIIPLMQHDAVQTYHWMSAGQFLTAVALGQVTPGPVVQ